MRCHVWSLKANFSLQLYGNPSNPVGMVFSGLSVQQEGEINQKFTVSMTCGMKSIPSKQPILLRT